LAPGETIYSARFMGETLYLVTFRKIDPLFIIDLQDAEAPKVLGELKITGYSDYLHMYDTGYLIGVGKETVGADFGNFAWYQGIKISLFNVTDQSNPQEVDKTEIGDRGTDSPVLRDHHAFLFDRERQLLVLPVKVAEIDPEQYPYGITDNAYGEYVWQGAYVYSISVEDGLELRGRITHIENITDVQGNYYSSPYLVERSLFIEDVLYTISGKKVMMNSIESLNWIGEIDL
ncbi:beta-propeller domain-containing protein, partial [Candidatus Bathyarchaeota archaeon]|nr:beta-propeller domain-containing protein [Candidatus Bathyarchaeota archaeon]